MAALPVEMGGGWDPSRGHHVYDARGWRAWADRVDLEGDNENLGHGHQGMGSICAELPIDLAHDLAPAVLELLEGLVGDQRIVDMRAQFQHMTHNGARSKGIFSSTCLKRILRLIARLARLIGVYARLAAVIDNIFDRARDLVARVGPTDALQNIMMNCMFHREEIYQGTADIRRMFIVLEDLQLDLHCAYTRVVAHRLLHRYTVTFDRHLEEFEENHGALRRKVVAAADVLRANPLVLRPVICLALVRLTNVPGQTRRRPLLVVSACLISATIVHSCGMANSAAFPFWRFVRALERLHLGLETEYDPAVFESLDHYRFWLDRVDYNDGRDGVVRGNSSIPYTLGFGGLAQANVTYEGSLLQVAWPEPSRAVEELLGMGEGDFGLLDVWGDRDVRRRVIDLYNAETSFHTGSLVPGEYLEKLEREWRSAS